MIITNEHGAELELDVADLDHIYITCLEDDGHRATMQLTRGQTIVLMKAINKKFNLTTGDIK